MFVRRSPQKTHDRSRKDSQQKQSLLVRQAITAKDSRQKPQGFAAKAIVGCSSGDHRKRLTTEAARIRSKSNRYLFVRRSPQKTHDRSRKDSQQKQSLVVRKAITAKDSRQKPQGFAAKAIVGCSSGDHRKRLTTEAARIRSKSNRYLFVRRSPQKTHDRSRKDSQQKQSLVVRQAITAKDSQQKPQGFAAKAIVGCSSGDHRKRLTTEAARIRSKSNRWLFVRRSPQKTHDRSRKDSQQKQSLLVRQAITAKDSRQKPQGFAAKAIVTCSSGDHRKRLTTEAARIRSKSNRYLFVRRSPQKTHDRSRKDSQQKQSLVVRKAITAKDSRQKPQGFAAKAIVGCSSGDHRKRLTTEAARIRSKSNRYLFVRRSPQKTHDRSRKDSQQKQSLVVRQAITAKDSRQKPQGFAAKAIVGCS